MKNLIFVVLFVSSFLLCANSSFSLTVNQFQNHVVSIQEWVEYVLIGNQWFKITHFEDGSEIIQAVHSVGE